MRADRRAHPLRIGFAGAGMVAELHALAISRSAEAGLTAVFDPDAELANARAAQWGCRAHATLDGLLADELDAIFVLTPTEAHVETAIAALETGKHTLVEKPVASDLGELERLVSVADAADVVCMPGHNYAYVPELARMRRLARDGRLGDLRLLSIMFAIAHTEEVAGHYEGVVRLVLPHHAYLAVGLLGLPERVSAGVTEPGWDHLSQPDQAWMALDYPPHGTALLFATLAVDDDSADPWTFVVKALGTKGSASATWRSGIYEADAGSMATGYAAYEESYELELAAFCRAVRGEGSAIASTLADAVAVERVLTAAETAARSHRAVRP
jgi:predicted dehydrogenase